MYRGASGNRRMTERGFGGPGRSFGPNGPQRGDTTALIGLCAPPGPSPHAAKGAGPPRAAAPLGAAALGGSSPLGACGEGPRGGAQPHEGCCVSHLWPIGPATLAGTPRNSFRSSDDSPVLPGTLPDSDHSHPIYQSSSPDHSGDPRHVRDLIRDSEQPSVTMHCSH